MADSENVEKKPELSHPEIILPANATVAPIIPLLASKRIIKKVVVLDREKFKNAGLQQKLAQAVSKLRASQATNTIAKTCRAPAIIKSEPVGNNNQPYFSSFRNEQSSNDSKDTKVKILSIEKLSSSEIKSILNKKILEKANLQHSIAPCTSTDSTRFAKSPQKCTKISTKDKNLFPVKNQMGMYINPYKALNPEIQIQNAVNEKESNPVLKQQSETEEKYDTFAGFSSEEMSSDQEALRRLSDVVDSSKPFDTLFSASDDPNDNCDKGKDLEIKKSDSGPRKPIGRKPIPLTVLNAAKSNREKRRTKMKPSNDVKENTKSSEKIIQNLPGTQTPKPSTSKEVSDNNLESNQILASRTNTEYGVAGSNTSVSFKQQVEDSAVHSNILNTNLTDLSDIISQNLQHIGTNLKEDPGDIFVDVNVGDIIDMSSPNVHFKIEPETNVFSVSNMGQATEINHSDLSVGCSSERPDNSMVIENNYSLNTLRKETEDINFNAILSSIQSSVNQFPDKCELNKSKDILFENDLSPEMKEYLKSGMVNVPQQCLRSSHKEDSSSNIHCLPYKVPTIQNSNQHQPVNIAPEICNIQPNGNPKEVLPQSESSLIQRTTSEKDEDVNNILMKFLKTDIAQDNKSLLQLLLPHINKDSLVAELNQITNFKPTSIESTSILPAPIKPECNEEEDAVDFILGCSKLFSERNEDNVREEEEYYISDESNQSSDIPMNYNQEDIPLDTKVSFKSPIHTGFQSENTICDKEFTSSEMEAASTIIELNRMESESHVPLIEHGFIYDIDQPSAVFGGNYEHLQSLSESNDKNLEEIIGDHIPNAKSLIKNPEIHQERTSIDLKNCQAMNKLPMQLNQTIVQQTDPNVDEENLGEKPKRKRVLSRKAIESNLFIEDLKRKNKPKNIKKDQNVELESSASEADPETPKKRKRGPNKNNKLEILDKPSKSVSEVESNSMFQTETSFINLISDQNLNSEIMDVDNSSKQAENMKHKEKELSTSIPENQEIALIDYSKTDISVSDIDNKLPDAVPIVAQGNISNVSNITELYINPNVTTKLLFDSKKIEISNIMPSFSPAKEIKSMDESAESNLEMGEKSKKHEDGKIMDISIREPAAEVKIPENKSQNPFKRKKGKPNLITKPSKIRNVTQNKNNAIAAITNTADEGFSSLINNFKNNIDDQRSLNNGKQSLKLNQFQAPQQKDIKITDNSPNFEQTLLYDLSHPDINSILPAKETKDKNSLKTTFESSTSFQENVEIKEIVVSGVVSDTPVVEATCEQKLDRNDNSPTKENISEISHKNLDINRVGNVAIPSPKIYVEVVPDNSSPTTENIQEKRDLLVVSDTSLGSEISTKTGIEISQSSVLFKISDEPHPIVRSLVEFKENQSAPAKNIEASRWDDVSSTKQDETNLSFVGKPWRSTSSEKLVLDSDNRSAIVTPKKADTTLKTPSQNLCRNLDSPAKNSKDQGISEETSLSSSETSGKELEINQLQLSEININQIPTSSDHFSEKPTNLQKNINVDESNFSPTGLSVMDKTEQSFIVENCLGSLITSKENVMIMQAGISRVGSLESIASPQYEPILPLKNKEQSTFNSAEENVHHSLSCTSSIEANIVLDTDTSQAGQKITENHAVLSISKEKESSSENLKPEIVVQQISDVSSIKKTTAEPVSMMIPKKLPDSGFKENKLSTNEPELNDSKLPSTSVALMSACVDAERDDKAAINENVSTETKLSSTEGSVHKDVPIIINLNAQQKNQTRRSKNIKGKVNIINFIKKDKVKATITKNTKYDQSVHLLDNPIPGPSDEFINDKQEKDILSKKMETQPIDPVKINLFSGYEEIGSPKEAYIVREIAASPKSDCQDDTVNKDVEKDNTVQGQLNLSENEISIHDYDDDSRYSNTSVNEDNISDKLLMKKQPETEMNDQLFESLKLSPTKNSEKQELIINQIPSEAVDTNVSLIPNAKEQERENIEDQGISAVKNKIDTLGEEKRTRKISLKYDNDLYLLDKAIVEPSDEIIETQTERDSDKTTNQKRKLSLSPNEVSCPPKKRKWKSKMIKDEQSENQILCLESHNSRSESQNFESNNLKKINESQFNENPTISDLPKKRNRKSKIIPMIDENEGETTKAIDIETSLNIKPSAIEETQANSNEPISKEIFPKSKIIPENIDSKTHSAESIYELNRTRSKLSIHNSAGDSSFISTPGETGGRKTKIIEKLEANHERTEKEKILNISTDVERESSSTGLQETMKAPRKKRGRKSNIVEKHSENNELDIKQEAGSKITSHVQRESSATALEKPIKASRKKRVSNPKIKEKLPENKDSNTEKAVDSKIHTDVDGENSTTELDKTIQTQKKKRVRKIVKKLYENSGSNTGEGIVLKIPIDNEGETSTTGLGKTFKAPKEEITEQLLENEETIRSTIPTDLEGESSTTGLDETIKKLRKKRVRKSKTVKKLLENSDSTTEEGTALKIHTDLQGESITTGIEETFKAPRKKRIPKPKIKEKVFGNNDSNTEKGTGSIICTDVEGDSSTTELEETRKPSRKKRVLKPKTIKKSIESSDSTTKEYARSKTFTDLKGESSTTGSEERINSLEKEVTEKLVENNDPNIEETIGLTIPTDVEKETSTTGLEETKNASKKKGGRTSKIKEKFLGINDPNTEKDSKTHTDMERESSTTTAILEEIIKVPSKNRSTNIKMEVNLIESTDSHTEEEAGYKIPTDMEEESSIIGLEKKMKAPRKKRGPKPKIIKKLPKNDGANTEEEAESKIPADMEGELSITELEESISAPKMKRGQESEIEDKLLKNNDANAEEDTGSKVLTAVEGETIAIRLEETINAPKKKRGRKSKIKEPKKEIIEKLLESNVPNVEEELVETVPAVRKSKKKIDPTVGKQIHPRLLLVSNRADLDKEDTVDDVDLSTLQKNEVKCGLCRNVMTKSNYEKHLKDHYWLGWIDGKENPINVTSFNEVLNRLVGVMRIKKLKFLECNMCKETRKSALGLLGHIDICGLSQAEALVECEHCHRKIRPYTIQMHLRTCRILHEESVKDRPDTAGHESDANTSFNNYGNRLKRKSVIKAEEKFKEISEINRDAELDRYIKPFKKNPENLLKEWEEQILSDGQAKCSASSCKFTGLNTTEMDIHNKSCPDVKKYGFICSICGFYNIKEYRIREHINQSHKIESRKDFEGSDSDAKIGTGSEDDDNSDMCDSNMGESENSLYKKKRRKKETEREKKCVAEPVTSSHWRKVFGADLTSDQRLKNQPKIWTDLFYETNYSKCPLFTYATPIFEMLDENYGKPYLPRLKESLKFYFTKRHELNSVSGNSGLPKSNWTQIQRFESISINEEILLFTGGAITAMTWIPLPPGMESDKQYLIFACKQDSNKYVRMKNPKHRKSLIMVWEVDKQNKEKANLLYTISYKTGPIHQIACLPSGGYAPELNRLALVALATTENEIKIFALPLKAPQNCDKSSDEIVILDIKPSIVLTLDLRKNYQVNSDYYTQCVKIVWSQTEQHLTFIAGYANGFVAQWELSIDDNINLFDIDNIKTFIPVQFFKAVWMCVTALELHYDDTVPRWLLVTSENRDFQIFDLCATSQPQPFYDDKTFRYRVKCASWPIYWPNILLGVDNDFSILAKAGGSGLVVKSPQNIMYKTKGAVCTSSTVLDVAHNPWHDAAIFVQENGDCIIQKIRNLLNDITLKSNRQRRFAMYTDIIRLDGKDISESETIPSKSTSNDMPNPEMPPKIDADYNDKYGLVFSKFINLTIDRCLPSPRRNPPFEIRNLTQMNCIATNTNYAGRNLLAVAYENGIVRIKNIKNITS